MPTHDAARRSERVARLLLLPALPPKLYPLRRRVGPERRPQSRRAAVGVPGWHAGAVRGCGRRCAAAFCTRAAVGLDGAALYRSGRRTAPRAAERRTHGAAESIGAR